MPFDDHGNWREDPEPENDWSEPYGSDTKGNALWGLKMLVGLIIAAVMIVGGWLIERYVNYELFYKPMIEADKED